MRKILIVLGIGMMVMSGIVFFVGGNITTSNLTRISATSVNPATYCKSGEKLVTPQPRNTLATPGKGFTVNGFYYCVDDAGNRRDITSDVMQNAFGQIFTVFPSWITTALVSFGLFCLGLPILIIGALLSLRGQKSSQPLKVSPFPTASGSISGFSDGSSNRLADQLKQLEDAHQQGLISTEEYERSRKKILDQVG